MVHNYKGLYCFFRNWNMRNRGRVYWILKRMRNEEEGEDNAGGTLRKESILKNFQLPFSFPHSFQADLFLTPQYSFK